MATINKAIDIRKKAKPAGWRFKGDHKKLGSRYYKRPENVLSAAALDRAKHSGLVVYEPRLNKADLSQKKRFEEGGMIESIKSFLNKKVTLADLF